MSRKTDWIYLTSIAAYSYLFWYQSPGINFLIMTVLLLGGLILRDSSLLKDKVWLLVSGGALIAAASVAW